MKELVEKLADAYGLPRPILKMRNITTDGDSGSSSYQPATNTITMRGKLSIITLLHEFAHARGYDERKAVAWSVSLFARVYPKQYARLIHEGHTLRLPN